ncbi:hypothetical protein EJ02DRAFT_437908 [Clathrospora elynae]|uniref:Uncharacterized protein n=1 Tax=Clathrospora elynae TaxID=706981 RepID=A0A6A5S9M5_9PLEO|nr:hypothetical protein EJ02DRAFT_437908 [Clathrospora elynae]
MSIHHAFPHVLELVICAPHVPNTKVAVKKQSIQNLRSESKNRVHGEINPGLAEFNIVIRPDFLEASQDMCVRVVSKIQERIKKYSYANFRNQPKNKIAPGASHPEHHVFSRVIITPADFKMYCEIIDMEYPEKCDQLRCFLQDVVYAQIDFDRW